MSEPHTGSDVAAIKVRATRGEGSGDEATWTIDGEKMWLTNGGTSNLVAVLTRTDLGETSVYRNMTTFLVDKEPGFGRVGPAARCPARSRSWATRA